MKLSRLFWMMIITSAVALPIRQYVEKPIYITSESMDPTLSKGVFLILVRTAYHKQVPQRGDIISFRSPVGEVHDSAKRVIAVPGDNVEIKAKKVIIGGNFLYEPYVQYTRPDECLQGDNMEAVTVPERHLFVMGDNRDQSNDSSTWKDTKTGERVYFIPFSAVQGKVRGFYRKH